MPKFVHIDIAADDPHRAADFFSKVFGWSAQKLDGLVPYWLLRPSSKDQTAIGAGVARREEPWQSVMPTIDVPSADLYGAIVRPKTLIPGVGYLVTCKDTEGNVFAILEPVAASVSA
jgi:predicted enzyme related to lactoylglutathione lyase